MELWNKIKRSLGIDKNYIIQVLPKLRKGEILDITLPEGSTASDVEQLRNILKDQGVGKVLITNTPLKYKVLPLKASKKLMTAQDVKPLHIKATPEKIKEFEEALKKSYLKPILLKDE